MPQVSVIVPVYNAEKYIERCVNSILSQTFTDFELILVDDGSSDSSGDICDALKQTDDRIYVIHKANGGASSARNEGISAAKGDYICFVDADDYVEVDFIRSLMDTQKKHRADFICAGHIKVKCDGSKEIRSYEDVCFGYCDFEEMLQKKLLVFQKAPWAKLFNKIILNSYNIRFINGAYTGEDEIFLYMYLLHCKSVAFSSCIGYNYLEHKESLTFHGEFPYENELISERAFSIVSQEIYKRYSGYNWINERWVFYVDKLLNSIYKECKSKKERILRIRKIDLQKYIYWKKPATMYERFLLLILQCNCLSVYDMLRRIR